MKVGQELTLTWRVPCREILYVTFLAKRSPTTMVMSLEIFFKQRALTLTGYFEVT